MTSIPSPAIGEPETRAAHCAAAEDLSAALQQLGRRHRGVAREKGRHRGADVERFTGELARQLAIERVRVTATTPAQRPSADGTFSATVSV